MPTQSAARIRNRNRTGRGGDTVSTSVVSYASVSVLYGSVRQITPHDVPRRKIELVIRKLRRQEFLLSSHKMNILFRMAESAIQMLGGGDCIAGRGKGIDADASHSTAGSGASTVPACAKEGEVHSQLASRMMEAQYGRATDSRRVNDRNVAGPSPSSVIPARRQPRYVRPEGIPATLDQAVAEQFGEMWSASSCTSFPFLRDGVVVYGAFEAAFANSGARIDHKAVGFFDSNEGRMLQSKEEIAGAFTCFDLSVQDALMLYDALETETERTRIQKTTIEDVRGRPIKGGKRFGAPRFVASGTRDARLQVDYRLHDVDDDGSAFVTETLALPSNALPTRFETTLSLGKPKAVQHQTSSAP